MTGLSGHDDVHFLPVFTKNEHPQCCCSTGVPGVTQIDNAGPTSREEPECPCKAAGQPVYEAVGVLHLVDCPWLAWFRSWGGCMGDVAWIDPTSGSAEAFVALVTGLSPERIDELGGMPDE